jgi:hypothetical protein
VSGRSNLGGLVEDAELDEPVDEATSEELERVGEGVRDVLGDVVDCSSPRRIRRESI